MLRPRKFITAERLAVAVFLAVAFGLWWGMQSRPEVTIAFRSENTFPGCDLSPDGTLCYVIDFRSEPEQRRLYVFDLATGQQIWQWISDVSLRDVKWTTKNHLYVSRRGTKKVQVAPIVPRVHLEDWYDGEVLGFDPRQGKQIFYHHCVEPCFVSMNISPDSNFLAIGQNIQHKAYRIELADLRTGVVQPLPTNSGDWTTVGTFSPDGSMLLCLNQRDSGTVLLLHDVKTGKLRQQFIAKSKGLWLDSVVFSPDGRLVAFCDDRESFHDIVRIGEVSSSKLLATLEGFRVPGSDPLCGLGVGLLRFSPDGSRLCIGTGEAMLEHHSGTLSVSPFSSDGQLHLFETRTFQRLRVWDKTSFSFFHPHSRFLAGSRHAGEKRGSVVIDWDTQTERVLMPTEGEHISDAGFAKGEFGPELHYLCLAKRAEFPTWMQKVRSWLGWQNEKDQQYEVTFRDLADGQTVDRWTFIAEQLHITPIPQRQQLLVQMSLGNGQHRLEVYSLPPRRPWFPILGWASVAGITVELLGLLGRAWSRQRRRNAP